MSDVRDYPPWARADCSRCGQTFQFTRVNPCSVDPNAIRCDECEAMQRGREEAEDELLPRIAELERENAVLRAGIEAAGILTKCPLRLRWQVATGDPDNHDVHDVIEDSSGHWLACNGELEEMEAIADAVGVTGDDKLETMVENLNTAVELCRKREGEP